MATKPRTISDDISAAMADGVEMPPKDISKEAVVEDNTPITEQETASVFDTVHKMADDVLAKLIDTAQGVLRKRDAEKMAEVNAYLARMGMKAVPVTEESVKRTRAPRGSVQKEPGARELPEAGTEVWRHPTKEPTLYWWKGKRGKKGEWVDVEGIKEVYQPAS